MTIDPPGARLIATLRRYRRVGPLEVACQLGVARGTPRCDGLSRRRFIPVELARGQLGDAVAVMEQSRRCLEADAISGPPD